MDTSTAPEPKIMMALTLRYVEDREEVADRHLRGALRFFMFDLYPHEAFDLVRTFTTETTDNIKDLEGEEVASRIGAALRRLIDRAEGDEAPLSTREWGLSVFQMLEGRCVMGGVVTGHGVDLSQFPLTFRSFCSPSVYFLRMRVVC